MTRADDVYELIARLSRGPLTRPMSAKLRQNENGRWFFRPLITTADGSKRPYFYCPEEICSRGKRAIEAWHRDELQKLTRGEYQLQASMRFGDFLEEFKRRHVNATYIESGKQCAKLGSGTQAKYSAHIKNHIEPALGDLRLCELTIQKLQEWLDSRNLAAATKSDLKALMSLIFTKAEHWGCWAGRNLGEKLEVGRHKPVYQHRKLTDDELRALLAALPEDVRLICEVALFTGLRISEVLGLQEKHIDAARGVLMVRQRYSRGDLAEPKTARSERDVPCGALIHRIALTGDAERFVFSVRTRTARKDTPGREYGGMVCRDDRDINQHFLRPAAKRIGIYWLGFGFHVLRRQFATEAAQSVGEAQAQRAMGHTTSRMTRHYAQADLAAQDAAVRVWQEELLGSTKGPVN